MDCPKYHEEKERKNIYIMKIPTANIQNPLNWNDGSYLMNYTLIYSYCFKEKFVQGNKFEKYTDQVVMDLGGCVFFPRITLFT